jgi:hypothetical protein
VAPRREAVFIFLRLVWVFEGLLSFSWVG